MLQRYLQKAGCRPGSDWPLQEKTSLQDAIDDFAMRFAEITSFAGENTM